MSIFLEMKQFNPSLKHHSQIGLLLSVWAFLFAFFIRPFAHGIMDEAKWVKVSVGFSILVFLCYFLVSWVQKRLYEQRGTWDVRFEIGAYALFYLIFVLSTYAYYMSPLVEGFYSLGEYLIKIGFKIFLVLTPILFVARRYVQNLAPNKEDFILIKGENKSDVLKIKQEELVCISNAQNYVDIFFLEGGQLKKKLIRASLKRLQTEFDFLLQVHRSHLINPEHIKTWKDSQTISLTQIDIPVSKTYKKALISL
ncbi:MAG: LytTR family DNA-binding domain-containing protein [Bacteroidota bacterium]